MKTGIFDSIIDENEIGLPYPMSSGHQLHYFLDNSKIVRIISDNIVSYDLFTGETKMLIESARTPCVSPDLHQIYYRKLDKNDTNIYVYDIATGISNVTDKYTTPYQIWK